MHVLDFLPYFYVAAPRGFTNDDLVPFREFLSVRSFSLSVSGNTNPMAFTEREQCLGSGGRARQQAKSLGLQRRRLRSLCQDRVRRPEKFAKSQR